MGSRAGRGKTSLLGSLEGIDFKVLDAETHNPFFWQPFNMQGKLETNPWLYRESGSATMGRQWFKIIAMQSMCPTIPGSDSHCEWVIPLSLGKMVLICSCIL